MKSLHHSFDIDLAAQFGVHEAIIIHHFQHWIRINRDLKRNFKENRTWSYQTRKEIMAHFPYFSEKEIRGVLNRLIDKKILIRRNFNKSKFDRTMWYAFVDEALFLNNVYVGTKGPMENGDRANQKVQKGQTIPDTIPDSKPYPPPQTPPKKKAKEKELVATPEEEEEIAKIIKNRGKDEEPIHVYHLYKQKLIRSIRAEELPKKLRKELQQKHKYESKARDYTKINGWSVIACDDRVEFTQGHTLKAVAYDSTDEDWYHSVLWAKDDPRAN